MIIVVFVASVAFVANPMLCAQNYNGLERNVE